MKKAIFAMLAVAGATTAASADDLILVDLSVTNQITITSTAGLSAATVSGTDNIGVYFEDFFGTNSLGKRRLDARPRRRHPPGRDDHRRLPIALPLHQRPRAESLQLDE